MTHKHTQARHNASPSLAPQAPAHGTEAAAKDAAQRHAHQHQHQHAPVTAQHRQAKNTRQSDSNSNSNSALSSPRNRKTSLQGTPGTGTGTGGTGTGTEPNAQQFHSGNIHDFKRYNMGNSLDLHAAHALEELAGGLWMPANMSASSAGRRDPGAIPQVRLWSVCMYASMCERNTPLLGIQGDAFPNKGSSFGGKPKLAPV